MRKRYSLITILMTLSLALQPVSFTRPAYVWAEEALDVQDEAEENGDIAGTPEEETLSAGEAGEAEDAIPAAEIPDEDPDENEDAADYEVVADTDLSDTENADQTVSDAGAPDGDGTDDLLLIDGLIEEAEPETDGGDIAPVMEELPLEDPDIAPDGVVTKTSGMADLQAGGDGLEIMKLRTKRNASAVSGAVVFSGSYGNQLTGFARQLYDLKVQHYITNRSSEYWTPTFASSGNLCTFEAVCKADGTKHSYVNNDASKAAKESLRFAMQSSADAFKHDYPQTFWFRVPGTYGFSFKTDDWEEGEVRQFYLSYIEYKQVESFPGAYSLLDEVDAGVDRAAEQILERASTEAAGEPTKEQVLREVLDYVDARAFYDYSALDEAESISAAEKEGSKEVHNAFRIYTCAGLFSDSVSNGVVCEGYAKAVKVLCDREDIGIPCVLLCGANHMWNAVQLDGSWYLLDATWCDTSSDYRYFLTYDAHHQDITSSNFSGSGTTTLFTTPVLSSACFGTAHCYKADGAHACQYCSASLGSGYTLKETTEAACGVRGSRLFTDADGNTACSYTKQRTEFHEFSTETETVPPTCAERGYTLYTCTKCGGKVKKDYTQTTPHTYEQKETVAPTCTEQGYTVYACADCGAQEKRDYKEALPHNFVAMETIAPTCSAQGFTVYICSECGIEEDRDYTEIDKSAHSFIKAATVKPTCTKQGYTLYRCDICGAEEKRDFTPILPHTCTETAVEATASSEGYTQHTCTVCGFSYKDGFTPKLLSKMPVLKKIKLSGKRTLKLRWKKAGSYTKYEVQYALSPDFSDAVTRYFKVKAKDGKTITRKIRVKKNRRYYVRVRAVSGDRVSAWSNERKKKTKK